MKHVFYVHSGITYLVASAVVDTKGLATKDVLFIFGRAFAPVCGYSYIQLDPTESRLAELPSYGSRKVLWNLFVLKSIDRKISARAGGNFIVYLPSERNYLMQFLQTHPLCVQRHFIEEGLLTYHRGYEKLVVNTDWVAKGKRILRFPFHLFRTRSVPSPAGLKSYKVFVATETANKLLSSFADTEIVRIFHIPYRTQIGSNIKIEHLFVFDPILEMDLCQQATYWSCLEEFLAKAMPRNQVVYVKFHPVQHDHKQYLLLFEKLKIKYELLTKLTILEQVFLQFRHIKVYGLCSSSLFYAKEWGHEVFSFSFLLAEMDMKYRNYVLNSFPTSIIKSLNLL